MKSTVKWLFFGTKGGANRIRIVKALNKRPYNANQLSKKLNVSYKTIPHHIKVLQDNGLIESSEERYGRIYFLSRKMEEMYDEFEDMLD